MASTVKTTSIGIGPMSIPVSLRKVSSKKEVTFDRAAPDGSVIERREFKAGTDERVEDTDVIRGVRLSETEFLSINAEAIKAIDEATKLDNFDIRGFVPLAEIPWERVTDAYFLAPTKGSQSAKALRLLLDALAPIKSGPDRRGALAGVFVLMPRTRGHLAIVYPKGDGLFISVLAWAEDWTQAREASETLAGVESPKEHLAVARELVKAYAEPIGLIDEITDDVRERRAELIAQAAAGTVVKAPAADGKPKASNDLMAQLEASLAAAKTKGKGKVAA